MCLSAWSTLILSSFSSQGEMNIQIKSTMLCHYIMSTIISFSLNPGVSFLYYMFMLVLRLKSDLLACNALLVPFLFSFHILITFSYGSPSCLMYIYIVTIPTYCDYYTPRSGSGIRFKTFILCCPFYCYYGLLFSMS